MFKKNVVSSGFSWHIGRKLANLFWDFLHLIIGLLVFLFLYLFGFFD